MKKGLFIAGCFFTAVLLFLVSMTLVLLLAFSVAAAFSG